eukprot:419441_1
MAALNDDTIICKSALSDSFLLYLINESPEAQNVKPYEYKYLKHNKKFKLTKHVAIEIYLGLHRLINRNKVKKWRKHSNDGSKRERHDRYRPLITHLIYQLIIKLCGNVSAHSTDDSFINAMYDDIAAIHHKSSLQNTKTRMAYLKEDYVLGKCNVDFKTVETQKQFKLFQTMSQRNGLSNDENPFKPFKFSLDIELLLTQSRQQCGYCGKSSHLYCPYCKVPFPISTHSISNPYMPFPTITLPIAVDIIRHPKEMVHVCSSVHACIVAPQQVRMYEYPNVPALSAQDGVYLLYPSEKATFIDEMDLSNVNKIVVIESRWKGNTPIYKHKELLNLPHCKIRNRQTLYWRYQEKSLEHLATIEAIYYGVIDCWNAQNKGKTYNGQYDDLLMLFAHHHQKIRNTNNTMSFWTT